MNEIVLPYEIIPGKHVSIVLPYEIIPVKQVSNIVQPEASLMVAEKYSRLVNGWRDVPTLYNKSFGGGGYPHPELLIISLEII